MNHITSYNPLPVEFERGEGIWLYDNQGQKYLDALSGIAVTGLGHSHPKLTQALCEQAGKLLHTSNVYHITYQQKLAEKLTALSGMEQVFFSNSGAEANEAAIKLARLYGHSKNIENPTIIVMEKAFHGRTMATLTASGSRKVQAGFEPLVPGFVRAPYNDIEAIKHIAENRDDIVGVMLEPIQGEGGIHPADIDYLNQLGAICDDNAWLFILDEIQTGVARTGTFYAYMHSQIKPDVLTSAKGLGNGIPIGACLISGRAKDLFVPGKHGSTFGGNPFACRAALTVCETIEQQNLCQHAAKIGDYLKQSLTERFANHSHVKDIRGWGLMLGIELDKPCREMMKIGLEHRILFNVTQENTLRILPPLIIEKEDADEIVKRIAACIDAFYA